MNLPEQMRDKRAAKSVVKVFSALAACALLSSPARASLFDLSYNVSVAGHSSAHGAVFGTFSPDSGISDGMVNPDFGASSWTTQGAGTADQFVLFILGQHSVLAPQATSLYALGGLGAAADTPLTVAWSSEASSWAGPFVAFRGGRHGVALAGLSEASAWSDRFAAPYPAWSLGLGQGVATSGFENPGISENASRMFAESAVARAFAPTIGSQTQTLNFDDVTGSGDASHILPGGLAAAVTAVPEPVTYALEIFGLLFLGDKLARSRRLQIRRED
jgi:hypothetical protein